MLKSLRLSLLIGPMLPIPAPPPVIEALTAVQVTTSSGQRSGFQLTFAVGADSLISRVLLPAGLFDPKIRVVIIAIVNGMPSVLMDGIIIRQEVAASNDPGMATLTITGEDLTLLMDLNELLRLPFPAMTPELRVGALIAKYLPYGMVPVVVPTLFPDFPLPIEEIPFQKGSDLAYINELAKKNGYVFYQDPGPLPGASLAYWGPEVRVGIPQPALSIGFDAASNVDSLSFSMDGSSREQLAVSIQEPLTKIPIPIPIPEISLLSPPLALRQAPALKYTFLADAAKLNPLRAVAQGLGKAAASADAVTGSGQLDVFRYGRVLQPRRLVGVRGAGLAYDGLYFVKSVTHTINPRRGEYKQSFSLARNGLIPLTPVVVP